MLTTKELVYKATLDVELINRMTVYEGHSKVVWEVARVGGLAWLVPHICDSLVWSDVFSSLFRSDYL